MNKKTAIVTGSSSGFGLWCAIELAKSGFHVIATMRNLKKQNILLDVAKKENVADSVKVHPLDITSKESINDFSRFLHTQPSVDVLVNNAGMAIGGFCEELSVEDYRRQFETNFFGVIAVTQAVLPRMRKQRSGRIINMSSISGRIGFPGLSAYAASKHALEGYSESLRLELKPFGINVVLIEPGSYRTNIWSSVDNMEQNQDSPYLLYTERILREMESGKAYYGEPRDVGKLAAHIASQEKSLDFRYPVGTGVKRNIFLKNALPWRMIEKMVMKRLQ